MLKSTSRWFAIPSIKTIATLLASAFFSFQLSAQHSIAREWNELLLQTLQEDLARPHVQARNVFHFSIALYDAWAIYDDESTPYLLGKNVNGYTCPCKNLTRPADVEAARKEAMSFAAYRFLMARFAKSPQINNVVGRCREIMQKYGYDFRNYSIDYTSGSPAALGNYIAQCVMQMGAQDGSAEDLNYLDTRYQPENPVLEVVAPYKRSGANPNRWQPLKLKNAIDHDGYPVAECRCLGRPFASLIDSVDENGRKRFTGTQTFQGSDWGRVKPFALKSQNRKTFNRAGHDYFLYHDPGSDFFPTLDTLKGEGSSKDFLWNYTLVGTWSALLNTKDTTRWEVSPRSMGNIGQYPKNLSELAGFYKAQTGRDAGPGHPLNPHTGQPYAPALVPRADYIRAAVQYWSEGPNSETPVGHWITLLNYISDQPGLSKKFHGKGRMMSDLEWEVKSYFALSGALHDAAIAAWGVKGWYNGARPITALRYMASLGQSSNPKLPSYHPAGIPLQPGRIELIKKGDALAGAKNVNIGKIKIFAWEGPFNIADPKTEKAGVGWILAENWYPYQPKTFVSPPAPGFVSAHAAFAHSAAELLTQLTGDAYFPGGMGEYKVTENSPFLLIEKGPATEIPLQWATYRDAADQAGLSRVWGGLNAPYEDIPGRLIGMAVGKEAFDFAKTYFFKDRDRDGVLSCDDCDDNNKSVYPGAVEKCDGLDNDCNGVVDDVTPPCGGG